MADRLFNPAHDLFIFKFAISEGKKTTSFTLFINKQIHFRNTKAFIN